MEILPLELWHEILVRLPVRTLLTLKCVSKSFLSIIQNPNFTSQHLTRFNSDHQRGSHLILLHFPDKMHPDFCKLVVRTYNSPTQTSDHLLEIPVYWGFYGCCIVGNVNGLLLMRNLFSTPNSPSLRYITLWNLSIKKPLNIPLPPGSDLRRNQLGFGYDRVSDDYKVVVVIFDEDRSSTLVEIYSLRDRSWRSMKVDVIPSKWWLSTSVYANGVIRWIGGDHLSFHVNTVSHVVSFDLRNELFSYKELPPVDIADDDDLIRFLGLYNGSVALFDVAVCRFRIWTMGQYGWSNEYEIELDIAFFVTLNEGYISIMNVVFLERSCELLVSGYTEGMIWYNTNTKKVKIRDHAVSHADVYVESLLWI